MDRREFMMQLSLMLALPAFPPGLYAAAAAGGARSGPADSLTQSEVAFVTAVAEQIIPATDTPGAQAAGVPQFLELLYRDWLPAEEQAGFRAGIAALNQQCSVSRGSPFIGCSSAGQIALLTAWDNAAFAPDQRGGQPPFFQLLKQLVICAYYTSKVGQDVELKTVLDAGEHEPSGPIMVSVPLRI